MDEWTEITEAEQLRPGDEIRIHFQVSGITFLTAAHIAAMESRLEKEPRFTVIRHSIPGPAGPLEVRELTMDVRVNRVPYGATGDWLISNLVVAGATIAAGTIIKVIIAAFVGVVILLSVTKIEKLGKAAKETGVASVQIAAALIAVYIVYKYL